MYTDAKKQTKKHTDVKRMTNGTGAERNLPATQGRFIFRILFENFLDFGLGFDGDDGGFLRRFQLVSHLLRRLFDLGHDDRPFGGRRWSRHRRRGR